MIYRTEEKFEDAEDSGCYAFIQCDDDVLVSKILNMDGWTPGAGEFLEEYLILTYEGKKYYRAIECGITVWDNRLAAL